MATAIKNMETIKRFQSNLGEWNDNGDATYTRNFKDNENNDYVQTIRLRNYGEMFASTMMNKVKRVQNYNSMDASKVIAKAEEYFSKYVEEESEFTIETKVSDCGLCDANDDATIDIVEALEEYFTPTPPAPKVRTPKVTRTPYKPKKEFTPSTPQEYRQYHGLCNFCNVKVKHHNVAACYVTHGGLTIEEQV